MLAKTPTPLDAITDADKTLIIAQQQLLITNTAVLVRYLEDQLKLSPPAPGTPIPAPLPPPAGAQLQAIMDSNTAAIRTQQAYLSNLQDLLVLLPPGP